MQRRQQLLLLVRSEAARAGWSGWELLQLAGLLLLCAAHSSWHSRGQLKQPVVHQATKHQRRGLLLLLPCRRTADSAT
jgi:hypothetical protein